MDDRQRLEAIVSVVCEYLPPDGISKDDALNKIIALVDPLPPVQPPSEQEKAEPVGYVGAGYITLGEGRISESQTDVYKVPVYTAPQSAPSTSPLTDEWIRSLCKETWVFETVKQWVSLVESAHGIGAKP